MNRLPVWPMALHGNTQRETYVSRDEETRPFPPPQLS